MKPLALFSSALALLLAPAVFATPIGYWSFDDGAASSSAGTLVTEANAPTLNAAGSGNGTGAAPVFSAQLPGLAILDGVGGPLVNPANGTSLEFNNPDLPANPNGNSGSLVTVTDPGGAGSVLKPASFTVEGFIKLDLTANFFTIFSKGRADAGGSTWMLDSDGGGRLRARFDTQTLGTSTGSPGFNQSFTTTAVLNDGNWHHVALTYNGATRAVDLFYDYTDVGGGTATNPLVYDNTALRFGTLGGGRAFDGWMDEVRLSDTVLAPNQFLRATLVPEPSSAALLLLGALALRQRR